MRLIWSSTAKSILRQNLKWTYFRTVKTWTVSWWIRYRNLLLSCGIFGCRGQRRDREGGICGLRQTVLQPLISKPASVLRINIFYMNYEIMTGYGTDSAYEWISPRPSSIRNKLTTCTGRVASCLKENFHINTTQLTDNGSQRVMCVYLAS